MSSAALFCLATFQVVDEQLGPHIHVTADFGGERVTQFKYLHAGKCFMFFLVAYIFKINFKNNQSVISSECRRVWIQITGFVGSAMGPNCLQNLSADVIVKLKLSCTQDE